MEIMEFIQDYREITAAVLLTVVIGLSEAAKRMGLNAKLIPLLNLIWGVAGCYMLMPNMDPGLRVFNGLIVGLCAGGLFSGVKNVSQIKDL